MSLRQHPVAIVAAVTVVAAASQAQAQEAKIIPAAKLFPYLEMFLKVPPNERRKVKLIYRLRGDGAGGLQATLVEPSGARTPLPIDDGGLITRVPTLAQLQAKSSVELKAPKGSKFSLDMSYLPVLRSATEYDASELVGVVDEGNRVMGKAAGVLAMAAPKMTGIEFPKSESGVAIFGDGRTQPLPLSDGMPVFRPDQLKGAVKVRLAKAPSAPDFNSKKK